MSAAQFWLSVFPPLILRCNVEVREESFHCVYSILSALSAAIWDYYFFLIPKEQLKLLPTPFHRNE